MKQLAELRSGDVLDEKTLEPVTRLDLIKYAGASGDYNPIHTIDEEAWGCATASGRRWHSRLNRKRVAPLRYGCRER